MIRNLPRDRGQGKPFNGIIVRLVFGKCIKLRKRFQPGNQGIDLYAIELRWEQPIGSRGRL